MVVKKPRTTRGKVVDSDEDDDAADDEKSSDKMRLAAHAPPPRRALALAPAPATTPFAPAPVSGSRKSSRLAAKFEEVTNNEAMEVDKADEGELNKKHAATTKKKPGRKNLKAPENFAVTAAAAAATAAAAAGDDGEERGKPNNNSMKKRKKKGGKDGATKDDDGASAALLEYMEGGAVGAPPDNVIALFESSPDAAALMAAASTGFGENNLERLIDEISSPDDLTRQSAVEELKKICLHLGPTPEEQNNIREKFYRDGGDPNSLLESCWCHKRTME